MEPQATTSIHPDTRMGPVRLNVVNLERMRAFYETTIGLRTLEATADAVRLGIDGAALVELLSRPAAPPRRPRTTGLYHLAILLPTRVDLARAVGRVVESGWSFTGASDHLVSEALYLDDPEGNGIEIYRDRPREEWSYEDNGLQMATLPLDMEGVVGELAGREPERAGMPADTKMGHVHLHVADLQKAEAFYHGILGFDVTVRGYPGALFVAAGGYHHHLGLNTWAGVGAPRPARGSAGLERFEIIVPEMAELRRIEGAFGAAGIEAKRHSNGGLVVEDPSGHRILLSAQKRAD